MLTEFEKYSNDNDDGSPRISESPDIEIKPTPEVGDNSVNVEIMLPRGSSEQRGCVISSKHDSDGNPIGNANNNPILDSRRYEGQFDDGAMSKLDANFIAISIHAQCDPIGNQYTLLDSFVDYRKKENAFSLLDQTMVVNGRKSLCRSTIGWQYVVSGRMA